MLCYGLSRVGLGLEIGLAIVYGQSGTWARVGLGLEIVLESQLDGRGWQMNTSGAAANAAVSLVSAAFSLPISASRLPNMRRLLACLSRVL